jgi:hypothetical protein
MQLGGRLLGLGFDFKHRKKKKILRDSSFSWYLSLQVTSEPPLAIRAPEG